MSTQVEAVKPVHASRDDEAIETKVVHVEQGIKEKTEAELESPPKEEVELEPREAIAQKFQEEQRNFAEDDSEKATKTAEADVINDKPAEDIDAPKPEMVEIKVNKRIIMVEREKVEKAGGIVAYQKEVAVMQGFKDLAAQKKILDDRTQVLDTREQSLADKESTLPKLDEPEPNAADPKDPPVQGDQKMIQLADEYHQAYLDGHDEKARNLLLQLVATPKTEESRLDPEGFALQVADKAERITKERNLNREIFTAKDDLLKKHPELKTDTRLFTAVDDETNIVEREFPSYTPSQVMEEAYRRVNSWKGDHKSDSMNDKENEKRSMNRPRAGTRRVETPPPTPRPKDSDYIKDLRKSRGQGEI